MEIHMKTITAFLTAAIFAAGAASAMADQQRSDEAPGYSLSLQAAQGSGGAYASARRGHRGPYASARGNDVRINHDFGNDPDIINFQEQGSH
jgi:hypothetical protein